MSDQPWNHVDPNGALPTPTQAAMWLIRLNERGTDAIMKLGELEDKVADLERDAIKEEAKWFLSHDGPMDMRKWIAREAAADIKWERDRAANAVDVQKELIRMIKEQMESMRSVCATSKEELRIGAVTP